MILYEKVTFLRFAHNILMNKHEYALLISVHSTGPVLITNDSFIGVSSQSV